MAAFNMSELRAELDKVDTPTTADLCFICQQFYYDTLGMSDGFCPYCEAFVALNPDVCAICYGPVEWFKKGYCEPCHKQRITDLIRCIHLG